MGGRRCLLALGCALLAGCAQVPFGLAGYGNQDLPRFVAVDFVDLNHITSISKFRSGAGHNYADRFEDQRSMKHYYLPFDASGGTNSTIEVYSPVDGRVTMIWDEGTRSYQVRVVPSAYPYLTFVIFHVATTVGLGDSVAAGDLLGHADVTSGGEGQTTADFDIAVWTAASRLVSYFEIMSDDLFATYQARGIVSRADLIVDAQTRDASPVDFNGSSPDDWVTLD